MLHINDLTFRIGGRLLFEDATAHVPPGHRVGLVGRNGTGKTTLFRLILGQVQADSGDARVRKAARVGTVAQEAPSGPESLLDTVLAADVERSELLQRADTVSDPMEIAEIHTRLADIDADTAPARAARILAGLGFDEAAQARPCSDFSGGWRMRVALAGALFARPDLLLLDEPTNHLDLEATLWLEGYLATWPGTLLVISHDRDLLNRVVGEILHLENLKLTRYVGGYDRFEKTRRERLELDAKMRDKQIAQRRHIEAFVNRFRAKATKARQAQSRLKMLERMEPIAAVMEERSAAFQFPAPKELPPPLLALDRLSVGYEDGNPVLRGVDLRLDMDDRIALLGANGNGKSTLVKLLAGRLKPMSGDLTKPQKLKVGYFAQHQADELDMSDTAYEHMARLMNKLRPESKESQVRGHLGRFGFGQERADTLCGSLSGGEKARLLFCSMAIEAPHILLLDEPTNHLDVDAREALVQALNAYEGAVVLVTHDPHIVELVADRLWLVADGTCKPFDGDLEDYRKALIAERRASRRATKETATEKAKSGKKEARKERAEARQANAELRRSVRDLENRVEDLTGKRTQLEEKLADPEIYEGPTSTLMELQVKLGEIKSALGEAEEAWLEASERLDAAQ